MSYTYIRPLPSPLSLLHPLLSPSVTDVKALSQSFGKDISLLLELTIQLKNLNSYFSQKKIFLTRLMREFVPFLWVKKYGFSSRSKYFFNENAKYFVSANRQRARRRRWSNRDATYSYCSIISQKIK